MTINHANAPRGSAPSALLAERFPHRGKVGRLPNDIREQLNLRLLDGETGKELAAWLNALPAVQSILDAHFNGSPISEVNLTHWRQGGYIQWLTEHECFDAARALSDGECELAAIGLSAERILNVLTVRFGQLLLRWDYSPEEGASDIFAFSQMAKKARILQGISRSLLAIHRIQSQSAQNKSDTATSLASALSMLREVVQPAPAAIAIKGDPGDNGIQAPEKENRDSLKKDAGAGKGSVDVLRRGEREGAGGSNGNSQVNPKSAMRNPSAPTDRSQTPFKPDVDPTELLKAV